MDWSYFENSKADRFNLKRLPTIKSPIRVVDETDIEEYREDFKGLSFEGGIDTYRQTFDDHYCYEVELESIEDAISRTPAARLGPLKVFKQDPDSMIELYSCIEDQDTAQLPDEISIKAEKDGLAEPDGDGYFRPTAVFKKEVEQFAARVVQDLGEKLLEYPVPYQKAVWDMAASDLEPSGLFEEVIKKHGGPTARRALDAETDEDATSRLEDELAGTEVDLNKIRATYEPPAPKKLSVPKQIAAGLVAALILAAVFEIFF